MTDRVRLIELLKGAEVKVAEELTRPLELEEWLGIYADHLLANGVVVAPMPMADWLRQELTEYVYKRCIDEL